MSDTNTEINNIKLTGLLRNLETLAVGYRSEFSKSGLPFYNKFRENFKAEKNIEHPCQYLSGGSFKIGNIIIGSPVVSAPLAGISDNTYRIFAKAFGSALNFTEMISSFGIHFNSRETISLSRITEFERPCGIQIFGSEPDIMAEAAMAMEQYSDLVDINMGCPVPKVLKAKSGGYLLNDEKRIEKIILKIVSSVEKPLTIKIRLGWDKNNINAARIAKIAEANGASAITIHGRTVKQGFGGEADYEIIRNIKKTLNIPVIASGDIDNHLKAKQVLEFTGCEAVMIGRGAKGSPWIFHNILSGFDFNPSVDLRKKIALLYLKFLIEFNGEERAARKFRKYLAWMFKGVAGIHRVKNDFFKINCFGDAADLIDCIVDK